jgi:geranylgeranyl diphosphate synthase type II
MMLNKIEEELKKSSTAVEEKMRQLLANSDAEIAPVFDSMSYSVFAGGKRIRPYLTLEFARILGAKDEAALSFAAAVEFIHTYSLIHDDLPCMDNDDFRRGKPTNHKVYGEAVATLAGDALLTLAFEAIAASGADAEQIRDAVLALSRAAGAVGMIGGQIIDMSSEGKQISFETLTHLHQKKTGALIRASAELGCIAAGVNAGIRSRAVEYAEKIGYAFQIIDDILDRTGDFSTLGKSIGSDLENGKTTFLSFMSIDEARKTAERITGEAVTAISDLPDSESLCELAQYLLARNK